jgi:hypothetical protein
MSLVVRFGCKRLFALLCLFGLVLEDSGCFVLFLLLGLGIGRVYWVVIMVFLCCERGYCLVWFLEMPRYVVFFFKAVRISFASLGMKLL